MSEAVLFQALIGFGVSLAIAVLFFIGLYSYRAYKNTETLIRKSDAIVQKLIDLKLR